MHYFWKIQHVNGNIFEASKQHRRTVIGKNTRSWKKSGGQNTLLALQMRFVEEHVQELGRVHSQCAILGNGCKECEILGI